MAAAPSPTPRKPVGRVKKAKNPTFDVINRDWFELAKKERTSGTPQLFAIHYILTETYTVPRAPEDAAPEWSRPLLLSWFAGKCGTTKDHAWRILFDAEKRGLIQSITAKEARKLGLPSGGHPQAKRYKLLPENWKTAAPYVPLVDVIDGMPEEDEPAEVEAEQDTVVADTIVLNPGGKATGTLEAVERYELRSSSVHPLKLEKSVKSGVWSLIISDSEVRKTQHANVANNALKPGTVDVYVDSGNSGNEALRAGFERRGYALTRPLAGKIAAELGDCPLPSFFLFLDERLERARTKHKTVADALLPLIAGEAREKHAANDAMWKKAEEVQRLCAELFDFAWTGPDRDGALIRRRCDAILSQQVTDDAECEAYLAPRRGPAQRLLTLLEGL